MLEFLRRLFSSDDFMPHGHCYLWRPEIVWLHVLSDGLVALAYTSIPFTIFYFAKRRRDLPFNWMFLCFALFIIACGATHYMEIVTLWTPVYRLSGVIKAVTALVSVPTAILLVKLVPQALAIPTAAQLEKANEELRQAQATLKRANRELEAFSYSVAHDLRAPLRGMNGFANVLLEDHANKLDTDGLAAIDQIKKNAIRMAELIDALLGLARLQKSELHREETDLSAMARAIADGIAALEPDRKVDLVVKAPLAATVDPTLARTLLQNLLENAFKFSAKAAAPRVEVGSATEGDGTVAFYVRDNGAGFDMAHAKKLFEPFQRLHGAKEFPGTGVGLATAYRIVERHGGRMWAEGKVGEGATFYFVLPDAAGHPAGD